jgi:CRP-like cAMP-binding protein
MAPQGDRQNQLLAGLAEAELIRLQPHLHELVIERGDVLAEAGQAAPYLYFPITCVLSLVGATESGASVEVAVIGHEGMASVSAALGRQQLPFRVIAQIEGAAWRVATEVIARQLQECRDLHARLLAYSQDVIAQVGQSAICNRFHNGRQRLARWLLMTADRADSRELPLTHEFMSSMVGGPRSAVTEAASALREAGAIDYRRGLVVIRSVAILRAEACECYESVAGK